MPKSGAYPDTFKNRALGLVGKPYGTTVDSRPGARSGLRSGKTAGKGPTSRAVEKAGKSKRSGTARKDGKDQTSGFDKKAEKGKSPGAAIGPSPTGHRPGDTERDYGQLLSVEEVDRRLLALGVGPKKVKGRFGNEWSQDVSKCVRAAIQKGYIELKGEDKKELDQVIYKGHFPDWNGCGHAVRVKLREVLYQLDYAGIDMLDYATVTCKRPRCKDERKVWSDVGLMYLTDICTGNPSPDEGKSHNHCDKCPGFGVCIGDYRDTHCDSCNGHYFAGRIDGYDCPCKGRRGFRFY